MIRRLAFILLLLPFGSSSLAAEFVVRPGGSNKVTFLSKASMESFEGKTRALSGRIATDPAQLGDSATVHFEVDLATLDTGIGKRNQHMRENHLETAKYPRAVLDGVTVRGPAGAALRPGVTVPLDVEGTFTLHGVSRRIRLTVAAVYKPKPARIEFRTTFPVALADYGISRPQFLFLKLADTQQVKVEGTAFANP